MSIDFVIPTALLDPDVDSKLSYEEQYSLAGQALRDYKTQQSLDQYAQLFGDTAMGAEDENDPNEKYYADYPSEEEITELLARQERESNRLAYEALRSLVGEIIDPQKAREAEVDAGLRMLEQKSSFRVSGELVDDRTGTVLTEVRTLLGDDGQYAHIQTMISPYAHSLDGQPVDREIRTFTTSIDDSGYPCVVAEELSHDGFRSWSASPKEVAELAELLGYLEDVK
ncbi:hypothetical protein CR956_00630 [Candidatus Saccharibacteria bacterium]|nr:MAG: hypothetical protein CR956_00630 [Candidatus Saccharibacteria bacterium]